MDWLTRYRRKHFFSLCLHTFSSELPERVLSEFNKDGVIYYPVAVNPPKVKQQTSHRLTHTMKSICERKPMCWLGAAEQKQEG